MHYRKLFESTLKRTWKNKKIWWIGLFAALIGNGAEFDVFINSISTIAPPLTGPDYLPAVFQSALVPTVIASVVYALQDPSNILVAAVVGLLAAVLAYAAFVAQGALIDWAPHATDHSVVLGKHIKKSLRQSGRIIIIHLLHIGMMLLVVSVIAFPIIGIVKLSSELSPTAVTLIFLLVLTPVALISSFLRKFSLAALLIEKAHTFEAFIISVQVFLKNWLASLELLVLAILATLAASIAYLFAVVVIAFPFIASGLLLRFLELPTAGSLLLYLAYGFAILAVVVFGAAWAVFLHLLWTQFYLNLKHPLIAPLRQRLKHLFSFHIKF